MSRCPICKTKKHRLNLHKDMTEDYCEVLLPALRLVAERHGYALGLHGSLEYDIDIIAAPWRDLCSSPDTLAKAILEVCKAVIGIAEYPHKEFLPTQKPCGRLAWVIYLVPIEEKAPYIDLSVMPIGLEDETK